MRIVTWNVNSVKQRLEHLLRLLAQEAPDVVCLQEIKCIDEAFPRAEIEAAGYNVITHGQKAYNGVAILSKLPLEEEKRGLPGNDADGHARYAEASSRCLRARPDRLDLPAERQPDRHPEVRL